jgi:hypothetical protein
MKTYQVVLEWMFKGRYDKTEVIRVEASTVRAAIGKAIGEAKLDGYREVSGTVLRVRSTVTMTSTEKANLNGEGGRR